MDINPHSELPGRRCQGCGATMAPGTHRRPDEHGRKLCPSCQVTHAGQPGWAVQTTPSAKEATVDHPWLSDLTARGAQHLLDHHGWDHQAVRGLPISDLAGLHWGLHDAAQHYDWAPQPQHSHGGGDFRTAAVHHRAHDSDDETVILHCPQCGSGQVVGGSDGSVNCEYCHRTWSIRLQPAYPAMPQTDPVTGQPIDVQDPNILGPVDGPPVDQPMGPPEVDPMAADGQVPPGANGQPPGPPVAAGERTSLLRYLALAASEDPEIFQAVAEAIRREAG